MLKHLWIIGLLLGSVAIACEPGNEADASEDDDDNATGDAEPGESDGGGTREAQLCERAAECLYLEAGYSIGDCTDIVASCTDNLLTSAHLDWNGWADECLGLNNCMNFGACYQSIDVCTLYVEVDVEDETGEVDPPSSDDGPDPTSEPSDDSSGGAGCGADAQSCYDESTIEACIDGDHYIIDCLDACIEGGYSETFGCGFDSEAGVDMCLCA